MLDICENNNDGKEDSRTEQQVMAIFTRGRLVFSSKAVDLEFSENGKIYTGTPDTWNTRTYRSMDPEPISRMTVVKA